MGEAGQEEKLGCVHCRDPPKNRRKPAIFVGISRQSALWCWLKGKQIGLVWRYRRKRPNNERLSRSVSQKPNSRYSATDSAPAAGAATPSTEPMGAAAGKSELGTFTVEIFPQKRPIRPVSWEYLYSQRYR